MIAIVIPTWNNLKHLRLTVESLLGLTIYGDYRIIIVDNCSFDETPEYLRDLKLRQPGSVETIRMDHNAGFVRGTNAGLALVHPGEHVLLLNDDVQIVNPDWLGDLVAALRGNGECGAIGPVSNFVMGPQAIQRPEFSWGPAPTVTNLLIGFCLLIRNECFERLGLLDERFGMGGNDDLDYSIRIRQLGYSLLIHRGVFVYHYGAKSISRIGGYEKVERETRPKLVEKWGQAAVDDLFRQVVA